jgi:hypothetical protein
VKKKKADKMDEYFKKGIAKLDEGKPADSVKEFGKVYKNARVDPAAVGF